MPYSKRSYRRRRTYRRRQPTTVKKVARREAKMVVARAIETKFWSGRVQAAAVDASATGTNYNVFSDPVGGVQINQGPTENNYLGQKINPVYLQIRGVVLNNDNYNIFRIVIVQSRTDLVPDGLNMFFDSGTILAPLSQRIPQFDKSFRILKDRTFITTPTSNNAKLFKINVSGKKISDVYFRDSIGNLERGLITIFVISDSVLVAHPAISMTWRIWYKDA